MSQDIIQALINGAAVAVGLFVLWSFVGRMREVETGTRFGWAVVAGVFSAIVTLILRLII